MAQKQKPHAPELLFNEQAEQYVIASVLLEPSALHEISLTPQMFGIERNRIIFAAMLNLAAQEISPTVNAVQYRLEAENNLERIGGVPYLAALAAHAPSSAYIQSEARLVEKFFAKREIAYAATEISEIAFDSKDSPDAIAIWDRARAKLDALPIPRTSQQDPWAKFKRTLADAYAPRPPRQFVVENIFSQPSLNIVYGAPGTMKSLLLADNCICVASGARWLENLPNAPHCGFNTQAVPVMWLDFDNGRNRTDERFEAVARARGVDVSLPLTYYAMPTPWFDASDSKAVDALIERIKREGAQLIVIDNLGVITGGADENSAEMASVMGNLRRVSETTNAALVVIHHQRKSSTYNTRAGESLRGHSSIEAALDLALLIEREDHSETINVKATKTRGADILPFAAQFSFEHRPNSKEFAAARFWGLQIEDTLSDRAIEKQILEVVSGNAGISKSELTKSVKERLSDVGINRIRNIITSLSIQKNGRLKVVSKEGDRNVQRFQLSE